MRASGTNSRARKASGAAPQGAGRAPWPADKVERWPIDRLIPYARNARLHSKQQIDEIAASIEEWGWTIPVLVDENGSLIAGHGRVLAARKLRLESIPTMTASGWSQDQIDAYRFADNQLALHGTWDFDLLRIGLTELQDHGFSLGTMGFNLDEVRGYLATDDDEPDPADDIPPEDQVPELVHAGEVWQLGRHRLICGDCTKASTIAELMGEAQAVTCFTSPPYAQQRTYGGNKIGDWTALLTGACSHLPFADDGQLLVNLGLVYRQGEWVQYWSDWLTWMRARGWRQFGWYVWDQGFGLPGSWHGRLRPSHEFIFHLNREARMPRKTKQKSHLKVVGGHCLRDSSNAGETKHNVDNPGAFAQPTKTADSVIRVTRHLGPVMKDHAELDHPAVFPVRLCEEMLTAFAEENDICYEPFAGAGSQIIAAERVNRICHGVEINPRYCDVILERWRLITGSKARKA